MTMHSAKAVGPIDVMIGANIRACRERVKYPQDKLAASVGVSHQQIQKYESGKNRITAARLVAIAIILGIPAADLLKEPAG